MSQLLSPSQQHTEHNPTPLWAGVFPSLPHGFTATPLQAVKKWKCSLCRMVPALREPHLPKNCPCFVFPSTLELTPKDHSPMLEFSTRALRRGHLLLAAPCPLLALSFVSDLFGCSAGKDRMGLSFCHNDSSFFFSLIIVFQNNLPLHTRTALPQTLLFILQFLYLMSVFLPSLSSPSVWISTSFSFQSLWTSFFS